MVSKLLPLAFSLQLAAAWAEDRYLGLTGRGLYFGRDSGCSTTGPQSCHNTTVQKDLCCFNAPGGLIMQTQLWDTNPSTGPNDSWTVHGLWPDNCDGTWEQFCDPSREENDITGLLKNKGQTSLLDFMQKYWKDEKGDDNSFWAHEWNKHGTCMSTLGPNCGADPQQAAIYYFTSTVNLFKKLPTYTWLKKAGITPSSTKTYTREELVNALKQDCAYGFEVGLDCNSDVLFQVDYYYNVRGSIIDGSYVKIDAPTPGSCPSSGIKYLPKSGSGGVTTTTTSSSTGTTSSGTTSTSTPTGVPSSGTISVLVSGTKAGGLLSYGTWSTQTPGKMTATTSGSGFTLTSSKGKCGVDSGALTCGNNVTASVFTLTSSGSDRLLAYEGSTAFTADQTPSGSTQVTLYTGSERAVDVTLIFV